MHHAAPIRAARSQSSANSFWRNSSGISSVSPLFAILPFWQVRKSFGCNPSAKSLNRAGHIVYLEEGTSSSASNPPPRLLPGFVGGPPVCPPAVWRVTACSRPGHLLVEMRRSLDSAEIVFQRNVLVGSMRVFVGQAEAHQDAGNLE